MSNNAKIIKGLRRARQNYLNALRRYEKQVGQVVTRIDVERPDLRAGDKLGTVPEIEHIQEETTNAERYSWKLFEEHEARLWKLFEEHEARLGGLGAWRFD